MDNVDLGPAMSLAHADDRIARLEKEVAILRSNDRETRGYIVKHREQINKLEDEVFSLTVEVIALRTGTPFSP